MLIRSRRQFVSGLACGCLAAAAPWTASPIMAAAAKSKPAVSAEEALERLKSGNNVFARSCVDGGPPALVKELSEGQAPFAVIIGCSDSRATPGELFNRGLGDLFIVRVAGNTVDASALGSVEYGVGVLGARLVVVMGHTNCGAVDAAIKVVKENAKFPGAIGTMVAPIVPVVRELSGGDDLLARATRANVQRTVKRLQVAKPIIAKGVSDGDVKVVGAVYDLRSGKVDFDAAV